MYMLSSSNCSNLSCTHVVPVPTQCLKHPTFLFSPSTSSHTRMLGAHFCRPKKSDCTAHALSTGHDSVNSTPPVHFSCCCCWASCSWSASIPELEKTNKVRTRWSKLRTSANPKQNKTKLEDDHKISHKPDINLWTMPRSHLPLQKRVRDGTSTGSRVDCFLPTFFFVFFLRLNDTRVAPAKNQTNMQTITFCWPGGG